MWRERLNMRGAQVAAALYDARFFLNPRRRGTLLLVQLGPRLWRPSSPESQKFLRARAGFRAVALHRREFTTFLPQAGPAAVATFLS